MLGDEYQTFMMRRGHTEHVNKKSYDTKSFCDLTSTSTRNYRQPIASFLFADTYGETDLFVSTLGHVLSMGSRGTCITLGLHCYNPEEING
ncbi:hypothetical protein JCM16418A_26240 [Paenibacillus pini]